MLQLKKTKKAKAQELNVLVNAIAKVRDTDEDKIKEKGENRYAWKFCRNYSITLKDNLDTSKILTLNLFYSILE